MKTVKKIIFLLAICFLSNQCLFVHEVYAVDTYRVSTDAQAVKKVSDTQYIIPLYLSDNDGIMGFRIYLACLNDDYKITSITKGLITSDGNFNTDNSADGEQYYTSVLWNSVENVTGDGSLMYIAIETTDKDVKQIDMEVNYSQEDTFDEKWKDVVLSCENISISLEDISDKTTAATSDITELVNNKEEETFLDQAELNLEGTEKEREVGDEKVKAALVRTLKKYDITSISDIPEKEEEVFWEEVKNDLIQNEEVKKKDLKYIDVASLAERVSITDEDYYSDKYDLVNNDTSSENQKFNVMIICVSVMALILILLLIILLRKGRGKKNEE